MADDPRAVRLARRRMLVTSKPRPKLTIPVRGSRRRRTERIKRLGAQEERPRLRVRK